MPPERGAGRLRLVLASAAVLLAAADTYVVVLALPDVMRGVGLDSTELGRAAPIVSVFLLGYVAVLPLVGRVADLAGRIPVIAGCLLLFALGSLVTATAHTLPAVVAGRGIQGVGAGGLVPATLALVADIYSVERRGVPLGLVGAAQEAGAVLGPLYGALVLAVASWRAIFWVNLVAGLLLGLTVIGGRSRLRLLDPVGAVLVALTAAGLGLLLVAPHRLVDDYTLGRAWLPTTGSDRVTSPLSIAVAVLGLAAIVRAATVAPPRRAVPPVRGIPSLLRSVDLPGAVLLAGTLGAVVLAFAGADAEKRALSPDAPWLLTGAAALATLFTAREVRSSRPLIPMSVLRPRPAWGGLAVSLFVGAALVAVLVEVPVFARVTHHDQLGAALLLLRFLAAVPLGAVLGGYGVSRVGSAPAAAGGMVLATGALALMGRWGEHAAGTGLATAELAVAGLGFGLAVAPVNAAVLAATRSDSHGLASSLVVVARTVGMLVGLSALTAIGLHRFATAASRVPSPFETCPVTPSHCPPYDAALRAAAISEVHAVLLGAAVCAGIAVLLALGLLGTRATRRA